MVTTVEIKVGSAGNQTNWRVITGAPSSGKTTLLAHLSFLGFSTRPEAARILIEDELSKGKKLTEIRSDERLFQERVLEMKISAEAREERNSDLFLERGMPDSIVYLEVCGGDTKQAQEASRINRYQKIFLLEPLPIYEKDRVRTENIETARRIHDALRKCYKQLGYEVVRVPVASVSERASIILTHAPMRLR